MVLELIFGVVVLVAASSVGTTMALRGFFGRRRYESPVNRERSGTSGGDDADPDDERP